MSARLGSPLVALVLIAAVALVVVQLVLEGRGPEPEPPPDVHALIERLTSRDPSTWKRTWQELAALGPPAVGPLTDALDATHRGVREGAAHALGDIGPPAAPAVPRLLRAFEGDTDDFVRWKAARALGLIGAAAADALPALQRAATDERQSEIVRASAQRAIEQIESAR